MHIMGFESGIWSWFMWRKYLFVNIDLYLIWNNRIYIYELILIKNISILFVGLIICMFYNKYMLISYML